MVVSITEASQLMMVRTKLSLCMPGSCSSMHSYLQHEMGVSGQLHALAVLSLGEEILLPYMQWAAWTTNPV